MLTFSERLQIARKRRGLSQRELANLAGVSNCYVGLMERIGTPTGSIKAPTLRSVEKLALALGVSAEWLAFGAGRAPSWRELRPTNDASKGAA